jgi:hypothetical protein
MPALSFRLVLYRMDLNLGWDIIMTAGSVFSHCGPIRKSPTTFRADYLLTPGSKGGHTLRVETSDQPDGLDASPSTPRPCMDYPGVEYVRFVGLM